MILIIENKMTSKTINEYKQLGLIVGKNVSFIDNPNMGSEPYLIKIGDNTTISFDCVFVNHDGGTRVLRNIDKYNSQTVIYGPIIIGKNCFIGCRSTILPNVNIGDNVIIGANSLVNRDIPSNCVASGVPCKIICTIDEYYEKHKDDFEYMVNIAYEEKKKYLLKKFENKLKDD